MADRWNPKTYPLWHGSAPMKDILDTTGPAEMFVRGEGAWLVDRSGRRFLDGRAGIATMMLGYSRSDIVEAMHQQAQNLAFACTMRYERPAPVIVDLAEALVEGAPDGLTRVRFTHTGSSAVEAALLMARQFHRNLGRPGRTWTVSVQGSYHGSSLMTMAASGQPGLHALFGPMPEGFCHVAPPDTHACPVCTGRIRSGPDCTDGIVSAVEALGVDRVAAIIVEPIKGLSGAALPRHYLHALRTFCSQHDVLLIFDEVFSGFGRMGPMYACQISEVSPDVMCLSKGMTAGYAPLGAVLTNEKVYNAFNRPGQPYFIHGSSTDAHPVCCAASLATLRAYEKENILERGQRMGGALGRRLADHLSGCGTVAAVRPTGAFIAIDLITPDGRPAGMDLLRRVQQDCQAGGVLIDFTPDILMIVPPLSLDEPEAAFLADTVASAILQRERECDPMGVRAIPAWNTTS